MMARPRDPAVKKNKGISSLCSVSHRVIQPSRRILQATKVPTLRRALALYLREDLGSWVMMKSCLACRKMEFISTIKLRAPEENSGSMKKKPRNQLNVSHRRR